MAAIVIMVVCCIGFKLDTGLFAFIMAAILILLGAADEKAATSGILSWVSSTTGVFSLGGLFY